MFITDEDYKVVIGPMPRRKPSRKSAATSDPNTIPAPSSVPLARSGTGSWSCTPATSHSITWLHRHRRRWAWRYERNVTNAPSSGWREFRQGKSCRICHLPPTRTETPSASRWCTAVRRNYVITGSSPLGKLLQ